MKFRLVEFGEWGGGITYYIAITLLATCLWDFRPSWTSCNHVWCDDASLGLEASYRKLELLFFWSLRFQTLRISWLCSEHLKTWLVWQLHQESKHRAGSLNCYSVCLWEFKLLKYNCPTSETVSQYFFRPSLVRWCLTRNQCTVLQTVCVAVSSKSLTHHKGNGLGWVAIFKVMVTGFEFSETFQYDVHPCCWLAVQVYCSRVTCEECMVSYHVVIGFKSLDKCLSITYLLSH